MTSTCARAIARFVQSKGVQQIFGLCGGHIQPIWDALHCLGLQIIDVRDERAAVHMAQAQAELSGRPGLALVTAGPGFTNALTGIANAHIARTPVLILSGIPPRPQLGLGALQELPQTAMAGPVTRYARTVLHRRSLFIELEKAYQHCLGRFGDPGPAYLDFPTDLLREAFPEAPDSVKVPSESPAVRPADSAVQSLAERLAAARRPVVIAGKGARRARQEMLRLLDAWDCLYLDTVESRGLIPDTHPAAVPALRGRAMQEADLILTVGRHLDYQLGYGSPAVFPDAAFVRIGAAPAELDGNRNAEQELFGDIPTILQTLASQLEDRLSAADQEWLVALQTANRHKMQALSEQVLGQSRGSDRAIHPCFLLDRLRQSLDPRAVVVADGGDTLSFCRLLLSGFTSLDCGSFGCLGVGVPYGIAASLLYPGRQVVVISGDGAFGFNAMEMDTCVRHQARVLFVVANNQAWNIERTDQKVNFQERIVGSELENVNYAELARSMGLYAENVQDPDEIPVALSRALQRLPALVDVRVSRDVLSPDGRAGLAQVPDYQALEKWDHLERRKRNGQCPSAPLCSGAQHE